MKRSAKMEREKSDFCATFPFSLSEKKAGGREFFFSVLFFFFFLSLSLKIKAPMSSSREIIGRFDFSCEIEVREIRKKKKESNERESLFPFFSHSAAALTFFFFDEKIEKKKPFPFSLSLYRPWSGSRSTAPPACASSGPGP